MRRACILACLAAPSLALRLPPRLVAPRQKFKTTLLAEAEAAAPPAEAPKEEGASVAASTVNLVKSIVGAGVLSLPSGIAAFADVGAALYPAMGLLVGLGAFSAYSFYSLGRLCADNDAASYGEAYSKAVGERTAFLVPFACTLTPILACLSYSIIIGDAFSALARAFGAKALLAGCADAAARARERTTHAHRRDSESRALPL